MKFNELTNQYHGEEQRIEIEQSEVKRFIGLKLTAYHDYMGARILFQKGLLENACHLAVTCLEKEFKTILFCKGKKIPKGHDIVNMYNTIAFISPDFKKEVNLDYVKALCNIYHSRYYDTLSSGYNYVILKNKFLAELDFIYATLEPLSRVGIESMEMGKSSFEVDIDRKNPDLYMNNYLLNGIAKKDFLKRPEFVIEFRIFKDFPLNVSYNLIEGSEVEDFIYEGVRPNADGTGFLYAIKSDKITNLSVVLPNEMK
jgi:HEPN domain-containing protein